MHNITKRLTDGENTNITWGTPSCRGRGVAKYSPHMRSPEITKKSSEHTHLENQTGLASWLVEVSGITGHGICTRRIHKTQFQDDQRNMIGNISTIQRWCRQVYPWNPNRHCNGKEYISLAMFDQMKPWLEKQRPCSQYAKKIVAFRKWKIDDCTTCGALGTGSWGENKSRNMSHKYFPTGGRSDFWNLLAGGKCVAQILSELLWGLFERTN